MTKVFYYHGTMDASKSANLLMTCHNYEEKGVKPILIKPALDTRSKFIESRIGLKKEADFVVLNDLNKTEINHLADIIVKTAISKDSPILLDECQFFGPLFVRSLVFSSRMSNEVVNWENNSIIAYGLLTDYTSHLFEGSKAWLEVADDIREIKTTCAYCGNKAVYNGLFEDDKLITNGDTNIIVGDSEYKALCPYHYLKLKARCEKSKKRTKL